MTGFYSYLYGREIKISSGCTECKTRDELIAELKEGQNFDDVYRLEGVHDQSEETDWAVKYMQRRINQVLENCVNCNPTDKFIAAALGQNGPGLHPGAMRELSIAGTKNIFRPEKYLPIDWKFYFEDRIRKNPVQGKFDTRRQLELFYGVARNLHKRSPTGWYIPSRLNTKLIQELIDG